jgi:hypothetical protein
MYRDGVVLEVKRNIERFEERFYDFMPLDFAGLPIIARNFTCYKVPGDLSLIFMVINPKPSVVSTAIKKQYLVIIDVEDLKAFDCHVDEAPSSDRLTKVFFVKNN